jgi:hypothetical protein
VLLDHRCNDRCQLDRDQHFQAMYIDQLDLPRAEEALRLRLRSYGLRMLRAVRASDAEQDRFPRRERWHVHFEGDEIAKAIVELVAVEDLPLVADRAPELIAPILAQHMDAKWWSAWVSMPAATINDSLASMESRGMRLTAEVAYQACLALVRTDIEPKKATRIWELVAALDSRLAVDALVKALAAAGSDPNRWGPVTAPYSKQFVEILEHEPPEASLSMLAELTPASREVLSGGIKPWLRLTQPHRLAKLHRGLALVLLAGLNDRSAQPSLIGSAYGRLYRRLADEPAGEEWEILQSNLQSSGDEWDRCRRLAEAVAKDLADRPNHERREAVLAAKAQDDGAASRLKHQLAKLIKKQRHMRSLGENVVGGQ